MKMLRRILKPIKISRGQTLVEFALVVPVLCLLFCGIFDFGLILHRQITMDNASRAAARRGAVGVDTPTMVQLVKDSVYFPLTDDQIEVAVLDQYHIDTGTPDDRTPDNYIVVEITLVDVQLVTPLRNLVGSIGQIDLNSRAEFLIE
jgi:hypothetical protein